MENEEYAKAVHDAYTQCVKEPERNKIRFLKNPEKDFSRERKITFSSCVRFCVQAGGGALQNELLKTDASFLDSFFPWSDAIPDICRKPLLQETPGN